MVSFQPHIMLLSIHNSCTTIEWIGILLETDNKISIRTRLLELFIDYLVILAYLVGLLIISLGLYFLILDGIPKFTEVQEQLIAAFTAVVPIFLIFSVLDYKRPYGTIGKRKTGLKVTYEKRSFYRSLLRNVVKFLPWQLAHIGVINGINTEFSSWESQVFTFAGILLMLLMLGMGLFRKDKRHLGDFIAGTQVIKV